MKEIKLRREAKGWTAQFVGEAEVVSAFCTDTLPTAYSYEAHPHMVQREISRLNPGARVTLTMEYDTDSDFA